MKTIKIALLLLLILFCNGCEDQMENEYITNIGEVCNDDMNWLIYPKGFSGLKSNSFQSVCAGFSTVYERDIFNRVEKVIIYLPFKNNDATGDVKIKYPFFNGDNFTDKTITYNVKNKA